MVKNFVSRASTAPWSWIQGPIYRCHKIGVTDFARVMNVIENPEQGRQVFLNMRSLHESTPIVTRLFMTVLSPCK